MSIHCDNGSTVHLVFSHVVPLCQLLITDEAGVCVYSVFDRTCDGLYDRVQEDLENFSDRVGYVDVPRICEYLEALT